MIQKEGGIRYPLNPPESSRFFLDRNRVNDLAGYEERTRILYMIPLIYYLLLYSLFFIILAIFQSISINLSLYLWICSQVDFTITLILQRHGHLDSIHPKGTAVGWQPQEYL